MRRLAVVVAGWLVMVPPSMARAQAPAAAPAALPASASVEVAVTILAPPTALESAPRAAVGAGLGFRVVGSPNCSVSAVIADRTVPLGGCAPLGVLTAAAQAVVGRAAREGGRAVVVTMTIDAGT